MEFIYDFDSFMLNESLPLEWAKDVSNIERDETAKAYMNAFWEELGKYANSNGGFISRNKYRIYLPCPKIEAESSMSSKHMKMEGIRSEVYDAIENELDSRDNGSYICGFDYTKGIVKVGFENGKEREQRIGKFLKDKDLLDRYSKDPTRLVQSLKDKEMYICISNHAYDIAGMSANRNWTSCMNLFTGEMRQYVYEDIKYGTLVAYIVDKNDTNIETPIGRVLIKPYKLARKGYRGTDPAPIVYSPEVTVYSPFVGLEPVREYLKKVCEEIQNDKSGTLRSLKHLYNDTFNDKPDKKFNIK